jgi:hypothetical protein
MALPTFTLQVPADRRFRALAAEVAARYVALVGGSDAEAASLEVTLADAMAPCAESNGAIELRFHSTSTDLEVTLTCGARSSVIHHPLPAGKS